MIYRTLVTGTVLMLAVAVAGCGPLPPSPPAGGAAVESGLAAGEAATPTVPVPPQPTATRAVTATSTSEPAATAAPTALATAVPELSAEDLFAEGEALIESGNFEDALDPLSRAIQLDPGIAMAYVMRAAIWYSRADWQAAVDDLDVAIALDPENADAYAMRGLTHLQLGAYEQEVADLERFLTLIGDSEHPLRARAEDELARWQGEGTMVSAGERLRFPLFTIGVPAGSGWERKDYSGETTLSRTFGGLSQNSVVARAGVLFGDRYAGEDFLDSACDLLRQVSGDELDRHTVISTRCDWTTALPHTCVHREVRLEDHGGVDRPYSPPLTIEGFDLLCVHPQRENEFIYLHYSQRAPEDELLDGLDQQADAFFADLEMLTFDRSYALAALQPGIQGVAVGDGEVWVTNCSWGTASRVDPRTMAVESEIRVGTGPVGVALGRQSVWIANMGDDVVARVDPVSGQVLEVIPVGHKPIFVAAGEDSIWVSNSGDATLSRIDPDANQVVATVPVGERPAGVVVAHESVWVVNYGEDTVSRVDPQSNRVVATISPGEVNQMIAASEQYLIVGGYDPLLMVIDPNTNQVVRQIALESYPSGMVVSGDTVWVALQAIDVVQQVDLLTGEALQTIPVGRSPMGVAGYGQQIWVTNNEDGTLGRVGP